MQRIDILLVQKGIITGRDKAKELIGQGRVQVNGKAIDKASQRFPEDVTIEILGELSPYVSRGGHKLEKAIRSFSIDIYDLVAMDIGSSTGGFTDCMLQHGAKKVYAVDVGTDQLVPSLRSHPQVVVMEQTNIRHLEKDKIKDPILFIGSDVSFLSLVHVLPKAHMLLEEGGSMVCLVKPQFEAGPKLVGKRGLVQDKKTHKNVLENILLTAEGIGFSVQGLEFSPITGREGNFEFLLYLKKTEAASRIDKQAIEEVVNHAHETL